MKKYYEIEVQCFNREWQALNERFETLEQAIKETRNINFDEFLEIRINQVKANYIENRFDIDGNII